jgi:hypothetical protein
MIPVNNTPIAQLPIIPRAVLTRYKVCEYFDNRFRSCARLLQAKWREQQDLPIGTYTDNNGRRRAIGSLISKTAAEEGRNFLTPEIAEVVRLEMAYQEAGALIDQNRLYGNLLSSMPLCFNLFAGLRNDLTLAARILRSIIPTIDLKEVHHVWFEHSPGRQDPTLTGDRSAFDVAFVYERSDGQTGLIGIEVKYSESGNEPAPPELNPRYEELSQASGLYKEPAHAALRVNPFQQLFREHLLAQAAVMRGDYAEAYFVQIAPRHNHLIQNAATLYQGFLAPVGDTQVPFVNIELEQVIEAYGWAGEHGLATALWQRYCDWWSIDEVVRDAVKVARERWSAPTKRKSKAPMLPAPKAA